MEEHFCKVDGIKSIYILKRLFYLLNKRKFLEMVRYNKVIQGKAGINIEDYKREGNKIKIGEKNGLGKEFRLNTNILLFEGEYINGKKNGKGKEYYENGQIKFEGVYLKGKKLEGKGYDKDGNEVLILEKNGKGKEYYKNKKLLFEGEYFNGKKWNGKGYNPSGEKEYELSCGKGYVKEFNNEEKLVFEGEYLNGERNGKGKEYFDVKSTDFFSSNVFRLRIHEKIIEAKDKKGEEYSNIKVKYEGEYLNGERNGRGKEYYINGQIKLEGEYLNGKRWNVKGYNKDGNKIFEIKNGKGYLKEYSSEGKLEFEGEFSNGERNGKGKEYNNRVNTNYNPFFLGVKIFEGDYLYDKRNGKGIEYYDNGLLRFEGEYLNGKRKEN